jgi:hypothetical protein
MSTINPALTMTKPPLAKPPLAKPPLVKPPLVKPPLAEPPLTVAPRKIASPLSRKATLLSVEISQWTARKCDKRVTRETNQKYNASDDAGRYNKMLIAAKHLKGINTLVSQARTLHYELTKPWCDEGLRILPNVLHERFTSEFRKLQRAFDAAADAFCDSYPAFIAERKSKLGAMFDENDYPSPSHIRTKFKLRHREFPVPQSDDFRSDVLDEATVADIQRELAETHDEVMIEATRHTARQIHKVVSHMSEKLETYGKNKKGTTRGDFFKDALVVNIRELVELLPALNIANDPAIDKLTERLTTELCVEDARVLRKDEHVRESVAKSADDILRDVESLLG